jgi:hypothetical protein
MRRASMAVALMVSWTGAVAAGDPAGLLTQGRLDADLGNREAAAAAFTEVADDAGAPSALRAEALVRLGLVRRDAGDARGAVKAYERAWQEYGRDKEALRLLVQAVGGGVPGPERWDAIWQKVVLRVDGGKTAHPSIRVEWPGVPVPRRYSGQPISLDVKDGQLYDVFRLMADVTGLNVVVHPGVAGTITIQGEDVPWDAMLDRILAPHGLAASHVGRVLEIARPERLGTVRRFSGPAADILDLKDVGLPEALRRAAEPGGREVVVAPDVAGRVTIRLQGVPWDQAFDVIARVNGLGWRDDGKTLRVARAADLR